MFDLPALPGWEGLHPLVVHFPIALLLTTPLLLVAAIGLRRQRRCLMGIALLIMATATVATHFAVATGEAAAEIAMRTSESAPVLDQHHRLADTCRFIFTLSTVVFAALLILFSGKPVALSVRTQTAILIIFTCLYGLALPLLVRTADLGGQLVHRFGIQALI